MCGTSNCSLCLDNEGNVYGMGNNEDANLGKLGTGNHLVPTIIGPLPFIVEIACGEYHTACLDNKGCLWTFGKNSSGELGVDTIVQKAFEPQRVNLPVPVLTMDCGHSFTVCIDDHYEVWGFGSNKCYALGVEEREVVAPKKLPVEKPIRLVRCQGQNNVLITQSNEILYCGGACRSFTQLQVPAFHDVACLWEGLVLLAADGTVYWMADIYGYFSETSSGFTLMPTLKNIQSISCGYYHVMCVDEDRELWTFGYNSEGQLGTGEKVTETYVPRKVSGIHNIAVLSSGGYQTIVKDSDDTVWVFGDNTYGQLGLNKKDMLIEFPIRLDCDSQCPIIGNGQSSMPKSAYK